MKKTQTLFIIVNNFDHACDVVQAFAKTKLNKLTEFVAANKSLKERDLDPSKPTVWFFKTPFSFSKY
jgi:hypothetical protein